MALNFLWIDEVTIQRITKKATSLEVAFVNSVLTLLVCGLNSRFLAFLPEEEDGECHYQDAWEE